MWLVEEDRIVMVIGGLDK